VPADDLQLIFDGIAAESLPSTIMVADSLDAALDEMEAALLSLTRHLVEETEPRPAHSCCLAARRRTPNAVCRP
jgi:predicted RNase H-like HicB family nuclease